MRAPACRVPLMPAPPAAPMDIRCMTPLPRHAILWLLFDAVTPLRSRAAPAIRHVMRFRTMRRICDAALRRYSAIALQRVYVTPRAILSTPPAAAPRFDAAHDLRATRQIRQRAMPIFREHTRLPLVYTLRRGAARCALLSNRSRETPSAINAAASDKAPIRRHVIIHITTPSPLPIIADAATIPMATRRAAPQARCARRHRRRPLPLITLLPMPLSPMMNARHAAYCFAVSADVSHALCRDGAAAHTMMSVRHASGAITDSAAIVSPSMIRRWRFCLRAAPLCAADKSRRCRWRRDAAWMPRCSILPIATRRYAATLRADLPLHAACRLRCLPRRRCRHADAFERRRAVAATRRSPPLVCATHAEASAAAFTPDATIRALLRCARFSMPRRHPRAAAMLPRMPPRLFAADTHAIRRFL